MYVRRICVTCHFWPLISRSFVATFMSPIPLVECSESASMNRTGISVITENESLPVSLMKRKS